MSRMGRREFLGASLALGLAPPELSKVVIARDQSVARSGPGARAEAPGPGRSIFFWPRQPGGGLEADCPAGGIGRPEGELPGGTRRLHPDRAGRRGLRAAAAGRHPREGHRHLGPPELRSRKRRLSRGVRADRIRCIGNDTAGYENELAMFGSAGSLLSKTLTQVCDAVINLPVLKDHGIVGVTMALKNLFGAIHNPNKYHIERRRPLRGRRRHAPAHPAKGAADHLRRDHGAVRRRAVLHAAVDVAVQRTAGRARPGGAGLHRLADHRAKARREGAESARGRASASRHTSRRPRTPSTGWARTTRALIEGVEV